MEKKQKAGNPDKKHTDSDFAKLKQISGERKYVDWDEEMQSFCLFGDESGFCYRMFRSEEQAQEYQDSQED